MSCTRSSARPDLLSCARTMRRIIESYSRTTRSKVLLCGAIQALNSPALVSHSHSLEGGIFLSAGIGFAAETINFMSTKEFSNDWQTLLFYLSRSAFLVASFGNAKRRSANRFKAGRSLYTSRLIATYRR